MANYRLKLARVNSLKLRVSTRIPANLIGNEFITITRGTNGEYNINVDYTVLTHDAIVDPSTTLIAVLDEATGTYKTPTLASLLTSRLDADLQAIAALTGTGILSRTADGTWALRTLQAPAAGLTITNPGGVAGNETFALANDLAALEGLASTGLAVRSATDTWVQRSVVAGFGMTVTNGDGVSGNMSVALTDPELVALAGLVSAADQLPYFTGSGTASLTTFTTFARTLLDDTTQAAMQTTLGLVPGTNVQAFDSDLSAVAALATTGLIARTGAGTAATRTLQSAVAGLTWTNGDGVAGNPTPVLADDLAAVEGLATTGIARRTGTSTWSAGTAVANSELATMAAYTFKGNAAGSTAAPTDVDIGALTAKASPVGTDEIMIRDNAASGAWKRSTLTQVVGAVATGVSSVNGQTGAVLLAGRNLVINGQFAIDQRNSGSGPTIADNVNGVDRWRYIGEASAAIFSQSFNAVGGGVYGAAILFAGTTDKGGFFQVIEGKNCKHLRGRSVTLSTTLLVNNARMGNMKMGIIEWTGTEDATTGDPVSSWGADGVTPTLAANWAFKNTPANLSVTTSAATFSVTATLGSTFNNLAVMIWNDDKVYNANDQFNVSNVQLEDGSVVTPYDQRMVPIEFGLCQRYYWKLKSLGGANAFVAFGAAACLNTTTANVFVKYPAPMRGEPVITASNTALFDAGVLIAATGFGGIYYGDQSASVTVTVASGLTAGHAATWLGNNNAAAYIAGDAEI